MKPQTAMFLHIPANLVLLCYLLASQPLLVCMLGLYSTVVLLPPVTPWIGLSPCYYYYIVVDDMIIINVDYIRRRMEGRAIPSDVLFHSSHPRPRVPGIGSLTSLHNHVWDAMGSPFLTCLASNISSGGPS